MEDRRVAASRSNPGLANWVSYGVVLIIRIGVRGGWARVKTPFGIQWLGHLFGRCELQIASFFGDHGAFVLGLQLWNQLGYEAAGLLGVEVTHLLRDIYKGLQNLKKTKKNC